MIFGRGLSRFIPAPLRPGIGARQLLQLRNRLKIAKFRPPRSFRGDHVGVAGLFRTATGLGRAAELVALTLEHQGHRVTRIDMTNEIGIKISQPTEFTGPADCLSMDITDVVFVINPNHLAPDKFDRTWLLQRCIIGHWIWEIEILPWYWQPTLASYDEIWAPTDLVRDVIQSSYALDRPVKVLPYGVDLDPMQATAKVDRDEVRGRLGLTKAEFVAGYSFAVDSNYYRKNPEDAVRAFLTAFPEPNDRAARLFLRCNDFANRPAERRRLETLIGTDSRIRIFDINDRIGIVDFYAALDVYISTSRAEGYGLNLVEAAQAGVQVISCRWRLAPEISSRAKIRTTGFELVNVVDPQGHYAGLKGATWAAPDLAEMAALLRSDRAHRGSYGSVSLVGS